MSRRVYEGRVVTLDIEPVTLPNGNRFELELVRHPGGAAVVALDEHWRVCLLRQYRHAAGGWVWEVPAGKLEPDEPPEQTARRELAEEAGLGARTWSELGRVLTSPGVFTEVIHLFLAQHLSTTPANPEAHEQIEVHWLDFDEALGWAADGRIEDAKSVIGLFRAWAALEGT